MCKYANVQMMVRGSMVVISKCDNIEAGKCEDAKVGKVKIRAISAISLNLCYKNSCNQCNSFQFVLQQFV